MHFAYAGSQVCGRTVKQDSHPPLLSKGSATSITKWYHDITSSISISVYQYILFLQFKNKDYTLDYKGQVLLQSYHGRARYQVSGRVAEVKMVNTW